MQSSSKQNNGPENSLLGRVFENLSGFIDTKIELVKIDIQLKIRDVIVNTMHLAVLAVTGFLTVLFLSITLGLALNQLFNSRFLGFALVTLLYMIPFVFALMNKDKTMFRKIGDQIFSSDEHDHAKNRK